MAVVINVDGFDINFPSSIDKRLIVDTVDGSFPSLTTLDTGYNYDNMIVWVRDEKAFYYLIDIPTSGGAVASDWTKFSGGATGGCAKSGYVSGTSFIGDETATASVVFGTPYESASYSVVVTGEFFGEALIYSIIDKNPSGFIIRAEAGVPLGATAMWITNCWDGSGLSSGGGAAGAQGPTGPGGGSAIDLEEIAFGTGTGITSSNLFTYDVSRTNLIFASNSITQFAPNQNNLGQNIVLIGGCNNEILADCLGLSTLAASDNSSIIGGEGNYLRNANAASIITGKDSTLQGNDYASIISGASNILCATSNHSSIIGGFSNCLDKAQQSAILGGFCNSIKGTSVGLDPIFNTASTIVGGINNKISIRSGYSNITSSDKSCIECSSRSVIIGGKDHKICRSDSSSIISGCGNWICCSDGSVLFGSSYTDQEPTCGLIGGNRIFCSDNSFVSGGSYYNQGGDIYNYPNRICKSPSSSILGGFYNLINCQSSASTIVGGSCNIICNSLRSNSIGGDSNKIYGSSSSNSFGGECNRIYDSCNSGIIGSFKSSMTASLADEFLPISAAKFNSILYSRCSSIIGNCYNSIISSSGSSILSNPGQAAPFQNPCHSLIIGGVGHEINGPKNSIILGGSNLKLCKSVQGGIGGSCDGFDNVVIAPSFIGRGSFALNIKTASNNISLDYEDFTLIAYPTISGMTVSLPPCAPGGVTDNMRGRIYVIKKDGSSTQSIVYISPYGIDTIDGYSDSIELINPWDYNILQSDGVNLWIKLGGAVGLNL